MDLKELASDVVSRAVKSGASAAEAVVREGNEFSTVVRLGQVETLKESGAKVMGVRVFMGKRAANTSISRRSSPSRFLTARILPPHRSSNHGFRSLLLTFGRMIMPASKAK